jgi:hypothetical protein
VNNLSSITIDVSELRKAESEQIAELEKFLKDRVKAKMEVAAQEITLKPGEKGEMPTKDYVRVLLKKYLHKAELKEDFRVIAGKEATLIIKERKLAEETE